MSSSSGNNPRRYGFSCSVCRRKKVRCDGARPACRACAKSGVECVYKPESGDLRLVQQVQRANRRVLELEEQVKKLSSSGGSPGDTGIQPDSSISPASHLSSNGSAPAEAVLTGDAPSGSDEDVGETAFAKLGVDENGEVQYFGATSRFYVAARQRIQQRRETVLKQTAESVNEWLRSSSRLHKSWERLAFANLQTENDVDTQLSASLLQIYWTWQHPLHSCVYRPCFTRDMALGGPYFSKFLLYTLYAHASRHASADDPQFQDIGHGEKFLAKAKLLLLSEMEASRPAIPTIQALLILGGRQCAVGKSSEGWLYTGMAIRMIKDIGLHFNMRRLADLENLAPEDLEVRKRLFLSAYAWDKSISICLGRPPSLTEMPYAPDSLVDYSDDDEIWTPSFLSVQSTYPPMKSYNTQTFVNFCRLAQLINESYSVVYNETGRTILLSQQVIGLETRIRSFYRNLPDGLRIENIASMPVCPPPHIFSLNILYHVTLILLYRPFLFFSNGGSGANDHTFYARAQKICVEETSKINEFLKAHHRTFNFKIQTYLVSYCVYTAATVDVYGIRSHDDAAATAAAERLAVTLKMLESEATQTPGIRRSIDIIKAQLQTHSEPTHFHSQAGWDAGETQGESVTAERETRPVQRSVPSMRPPSMRHPSPQPFPQSYSTSFSPAQTQPFQDVAGSTNQQASSFPLPSDSSASQLPLESQPYQLNHAQEYPWLEPGIWNSGAGFVSSALNWSVGDTGEDAQLDTDQFWGPMR